MIRLLPLAMLLLLLAAFRLLGSAFPEVIPNFQPVAALFFCGALMAQGWRAWAIPLAAWLLTYPAPAWIQGNPAFLDADVILVTALAFGSTFLLGKSLAQGSVPILLVGSVGAAVLFHLITNGAAWIGSPLYPKTPLGLWQSLWAGPVQSPIPNWVFLRNMTAANVMFTALFLSARHAFPKFSLRRLAPYAG